MFVNIFTRDINKVFILCPFWRCGSTLLSAVLSNRLGLQNLDEILDQSHPWNHIEWPNFVSSHPIYNWQNDAQYHAVYQNYTTNIKLDPQWQNLNKVKYNFDTLGQNNQRYCVKLHGDQVNGLKSLYDDQTLVTWNKQNTASFVLLYRNNLSSAMLSMAVGLITKQYHGVTQQGFLDCHKTSQPKTNTITASEFDLYSTVYDRIFKLLVPICLDSFNRELTRLSELNCQFDDVFVYEDFDQYDWLYQSFKPYHRSIEYDQLLKSLPQHRLFYSNNRFVIESF